MTVDDHTSGPPRSNSNATRATLKETLRRAWRHLIGGGLLLCGATWWGLVAALIYQFRYLSIFGPPRTPAEVEASIRFAWLFGAFAVVHLLLLGSLIVVRGRVWKVAFCVLALLNAGILVDLGFGKIGDVQSNWFEALLPWGLALIPLAGACVVYGVLPPRRRHLQRLSRSQPGGSEEGDPEPDREQTIKRSTKIGLVLVVVIALGAPVGVDRALSPPPPLPPSSPGPSLSEVDSARQAAIAEIQGLVSQVSLPATLINQGIDQGCSILAPDTDGQRPINCSYLQFVYARGSNDKAADLRMISDRFTAAGWQWSVPSLAKVEFARLARGPFPLSLVKEFSDDGRIEVSIFDNVDQLNSSYYSDYPKALFQTAFSQVSYVYGYKIQRSYLRAKCGLCSKFQQENRARSYPTSPVTAATPTPSTIDLDVLIPQVPARFDQVERKFFRGVVYAHYHKSATGLPGGSHNPELDLMEFRPPIYYNPPVACGNDAPDGGSIDPCTLFAVTPGGNSVYRSSVRPLLFVRLAGTLVVVREAAEDTSPRVGGQLSEEELVSVVDSLAKATPAQIKTISVQ